MFYEDNRLIPTSPQQLFALVDNHKLFSSHMAKTSWMMGGGKMETWVDNDKGQKVGSHIRMSGTAFGIRLSLDEVVTHYEPPLAKTWQTVGNPRLIVIGRYQMGIEITPQGNESRLRVFIDYKMPQKHTWLGKLFGKTYARWCVKQMIEGSYQYFSKGGENK